jgi:hypothetical protein
MAMTTSSSISVKARHRCVVCRIISQNSRSEERQTKPRLAPRQVEESHVSNGSEDACSNFVRARRLSCRTGHMSSFSMPIGGFTKTAIFPCMSDGYGGNSVRVDVRVVILRPFRSMGESAHAPSSRKGPISHFSLIPGNKVRA